MLVAQHKERISGGGKVRKFSKAIMGLPLITAVISNEGRAADFSWFPSADGSGVVVLSGPIVKGDEKKFWEMISPRNTPNGIAFTSLRLNTPGGDVDTGAYIGLIVRDRGMDVGVPANAKCASACFLIFAAGRDKYVAPSARIGVHSAHDGQGHETPDTAAATIDMTRYLSSIDVPKDIIGRLVTTKPNDMAWLTTDELVSMHFKPMPPEDGNSSQNPVQVTGSVQTAAPATTAPSTYPTPSTYQPRTANPYPNVYQSPQTPTISASEQAAWSKYTKWAYNTANEQNDGDITLKKFCNNEGMCTYMQPYYEQSGRYAIAVEIKKNNEIISRMVCRQTYPDDNYRVCTDWVTEKNVAYVRRGSHWVQR